jgi:HSP20 family protein
MNTTVENETRNAVEQKPAPAYVAPDVNIFESGDAYYLEAEMPGVGKEGLEITVEDQEIALVGRRGAEPASGQVLVRERRGADYRRVFELDPSIDVDRITAKIDQGMVTVTLPKSERVKPRKIAVE